LGAAAPGQWAEADDQASQFSATEQIILINQQIYFDAEDLVQETYLRAIPRMRSLRPESNLKSWLFTILRNIHLNQLRKQRVAPKVLEIDADENTANIVAETSKDPLARYVSRAERDWVLEAIQQRPSVFRQIVVLREYEDLSYQEIAGVLACPVGTVMSRLARARSKLRTLLSAEGLTVCPEGRKGLRDGFSEPSSGVIRDPEKPK
jgi:RNA polymerase sigma-70 factor (ECF subfamily)